jgi:hypothetical protein
VAAPVNQDAVPLAGYRLRTTFAHRWGGYLTIVVLVGLLGGVALGAIAAARRTQAGFPTFLASTNPSNLSLPTANWAAGEPNAAGASLANAALVAHVPGVVQAASVFSLNAQPLGPDGYALPPPAAAASLGISTLNNLGSLDGEYTRQDRATAVVGRLPDPRRADEIDLSSVVAQALAAHVGETIPIGFFTNEQTTEPGYGTGGGGGFRLKPHLRIEMKVVGLVDFNNLVDVDSLDVTDTANILFSEAMTRQLLSCCVTSTTTYLRLTNGNRSVPAVESEIARVAGAGGSPAAFFSLAPDVSVAERAIRPESVAIAVFGGIAALAALVIAAQAVGRQLRLGRAERETLRALGAGPAAIVADAVAGILVAIAVGSLLAVAVAIGLSPLAPIGIVRPVYPFTGVSFDWPVLGIGCASLIVLLSVVAVALAIRQAPHRRSVREVQSRRVSPLVRVAADAGLPAPSVEGIRFAVDPGRGRFAAPVRSAIVGTLIAVVVLVGTVTFGASLDALVSHPNLYGWNWDYELTGGGGIAPVPGQMAASLLKRDRAVATWSSVVFGGEATIDGQQVPDLGQRPGATVTPPRSSAATVSCRLTRSCSVGKPWRRCIGRSVPA